MFYGGARIKEIGSKPDLIFPLCTQKVIVMFVQMVNNVKATTTFVYCRDRSKKTLRRQIKAAFWTKMATVFKMSPP